MPGGGIDYLIYSGQRKAILRPIVIQVGVINTDSLSSIFLWDYDHVRQQLWIFDFSDESSR